MESLGGTRPDLTLVSLEGHKIHTHKSLLGLFSKNIGSLLADIPCCCSTCSISVPIRSNLI